MPQNIPPRISATPLKATRPSPLSNLSVQAFGAVGDGRADDTPAIQATIDAAARQGKAVFFPKGLYRIRIQPQLSRALTLHKNTVLLGAGAENSILKLSDRPGNYSAILSGAALSSDLSNLVLRNLTVDGSAASNLVPSEQDFKPDKDRFVLRVYVGRNLRIEDCRFTNLDSINVLTLNNDRLVSDITIKNNRFDAIGGSFDHDHSTIYIHGKGSLVAGNTYRARNGPGTQGARTAIEIHGDRHQVLSNRIFGYTYGINATGIASSSKDQLIRDNVIQGVHTGILLWSYTGPGMQPFGLENITIDRNQIGLDVLAWRRLWGDAPSQGIALEPNSNAPIRALNITDNDITFQNFGDRGRRSDALAAGVTLWRSNSSEVPFQNVVIAHNQISSSLAAGLYVGVPIQTLEIAQNTILNAGQGRYSYHPHYRSGMILGDGQSAMQVHGNQLIDNQTQPTMSVGILWQGRCVLCTQTQNQLSVPARAKIPLLLQTP